MNPFLQQAPWWIAGPLVGATIVGLLWAIGKPLGALGGYIEVSERALGVSRELGWRAYFGLGIVFGGVLFALAAGPSVGFGYGSLDATCGSLVTKGAWLLGAGTLMGFGARWGGGCTSGHGMSGTAAGSPASFVATMTFMAVAIAVSFALSGVLS